MISVGIVDPKTNLPFPNFIHNTTTYVGVPHNAETLLWVSTDLACLLNLEAENRQVLDKNKEIVVPGEGIVLSTLKQPIVSTSGGGFLPPWLSGLGNRLIGRSAPAPTPDPSAAARLYAFRAVINQLGKDYDKLSTVQGTVDFHLLCEYDYAWAYAIHLDLRENPKAIGTQAIWERAEGVCPTCAEVRARLQRDWTPEDQGGDQ